MAVRRYRPRFPDHLVDVVEEHGCFLALATLDALDDALQHTGELADSAVHLLLAGGQTQTLQVLEAVEVVVLDTLQGAVHQLAQLQQTTRGVRVLITHGQLNKFLSLVM